MALSLGGRGTACSPRTTLKRRWRITRPSFPYRTSLRRQTVHSGVLSINSNLGTL